VNYPDWIKRQASLFIQYRCGCAVHGGEVVMLCQKHEMRDFKVLKEEKNDQLG
jgi:hypothetical protein